MIIKEAKGQDLKLVGKNLSSLRSCYPGFNEWYDSKVIPKVASGERKVFLAENDGNFCGALILKNTEKEKKICTLFVTEDSRFQNIGGDFLRIASDTLKTNKLPITVSDEAKKDFFNNKSFNFFVESEEPNKYKHGMTEYVGYIMYHESNEALRLYKRYAHGVNFIQIGLLKKDELTKDIYNKTIMFMLENGITVKEFDEQLLLLKEKEV